MEAIMLQYIFGSSTSLNFFFPLIVSFGYEHIQQHVATCIFLRRPEYRFAITDRIPYSDEAYDFPVYQVTVSSKTSLEGTSFVAPTWAQTR